MQSSLRFVACLALILGVASVTAWPAFAAGAPQAAASQDSLYKRLGGYDALAAVTNDFIDRLATDPTESRFFTGLNTTSKVRVRQHVVDFLCVATGGPCKYLGQDMVTAHTGLGITEEDWNIAVKLLGQTLDKLKVPAKEQQDVVTALTPLKEQIVGH